MTIPPHEIGRHLQVSTQWAQHHRWKRGERWNVPPIPAYVLWLVRAGELKVLLAGESYHIKPGEVWLHAYAEDRSIQVLSDADWLTLGFEAHVYDDIDVLSPLAPAQWHPDSHDSLEAWLWQLVKTERADSWEEAILHNAALRAVVGWCWQQRGDGMEQWVQHRLPPWLSEVLQQMRHDPCKSITEHAADSGYSAAQFRRYFHNVLNTSPQQYLMRLRLEEARKQLESTTLPLAQIAKNLGFNNPEHFSRFFKKHLDVTPSHYRRLAEQLKI